MVVESGLNNDIANSLGRRTLGSAGVPPGDVADEGWISGRAFMDA